MHNQYGSYINNRYPDIYSQAILEKVTDTLLIKWRDFYFHLDKISHFWYWLFLLIKSLMSTA